MVPAILTFLSYLWQFIKAWWWAPLPFLLWRPFLYFWCWWRGEIWQNTKYKPIVLEVKIPREIEKPIRAMENVLTAIHAIVYQPPDRWEKYIDGESQTTISFEIVSIGGDIHFLLRFNQSFRQAIEAAIYSQYPEMEIFQVEDYIKDTPYDIPNSSWDLWGTDYKLARPDPYPIKTYRQFETEQEKEPEKIIDPIANLLESLAKIKPGEQFWIQMMATPMGGSEEPGAPEGTAAPFLKKGKQIVNNIMQRKAYKPKPLIEEAFDLVFYGKSPSAPPSAEEAFPATKMKLTPTEEEVLKAVETKLSKPAFNCHIRFIFLGKKDVFFKPNLRLGFNFFSCYTTTNMNALYPWGETITKIKKSIWFPPINLLLNRRLYLRCRKMYRAYRERVNTLFPRIGADKGFFVLNVEELASLYHFPSWRVSPVPGVSRVEIKKGPPPNLPIE